MTAVSMPPGLLTARSPLPATPRSASVLVGRSPRGHGLRFLLATMTISRASSIDLQPALVLVAIVVGYVFVRRTGNVLQRLPRRTPDPVGAHTAARPSRPR
jgi:hypothetical protein